MIRAYLRVSTKKQVEEGDSLAAQRADITEWASNHHPGIEIVEYVEPGISGATLDRPALADLLTDTGDGDAVVVQRLDRISRDLVDRMVIKDQIKSAGATLHAVRQQFDETPEGWLTENIDALMSNYEIKKIGLRTKIVLRRKAERGDIVTAAPYGYRAIDRDPADPVKWVIVPDEAETIRLIDELYLQGFGGPRIASHLNTAEIPAPSGGRWTQGGVRAILSRSTYHGVIVYGQERWEKHRRAGAGDPIRSIVDIDPIRTIKTWERLETERAKRNHSPGRPRRRSPFGSVLRCGICGSGMQVEVSKRIYYSYICSQSRKDGSCVRNSISESKLVRLIRDQVDAAGHDDLVATMQDPDRDRTQQDIDALDLRRQRLITAFESGVMTLDDVAPRLERFNTRREQLELELKAEPESVQVPISQVMLVNDIDDRETLTAWVGDVIDQIVWTKDTENVEIRFKAPA